MNSPNPTADGCCTKCGDCAFVLAEDMTEYSPCKWDAKDKTFSTVYGHEEASQADDAVRFYCASCGTGHMVPEGLP